MQKVAGSSCAVVLQTKVKAACGTNGTPQQANREQRKSVTNLVVTDPAGRFEVEVVGYQEEVLVLMDAVELTADVHLDVGPWSWQPRQGLQRQRQERAGLTAGKVSCTVSCQRLRIMVCRSATTFVLPGVNCVVKLYACSHYDHL